MWRTCFVFLNYLFFVNCEIAPLSVRIVDSQLIAKKRQDTLEMCRLFDEEYNLKNFESNSETSKSKKYRRFKRNVESYHSNPLLNSEDLVKVESIVDKLYDDMNENGKVVNYRRRNLENSTNSQIKSEALPDGSNRRFFFAPAKLLKSATHQQTPLSTTYNGTAEYFLPISWNKKWKHGIVPYFIDPNTYDSYLSETIIKAFDYIEKATCIRLQRLREKPLDKRSMLKVRWLYISNPSGIKQCVHSNEYKNVKGVQMVVFGYDCLSQGDIVHEIMHVLGFSHEHTRHDRDQHITINWDNIKSGYKKYFTLREADELSKLPYDYASVLHYPPRAFSRNGQVTISVESGIKIGQREGFSEIDVQKIANVFGHECADRNKDYLLKTCPSVVNAKDRTRPARPEEISQYFENRIWPYGIINYKIRDNMEFSSEERENMYAVIAHIEKETCIEFRDISRMEDEEDQPTTDGNAVAVDGDIVTSDGDIVTSDGDFVTSDGDIVTSDGDIVTSDGDGLTTEGDDITVTGDVATTDGAVIANEDGVTTDPNFVQTTTSKIKLTRRVTYNYSKTTDRMMDNEISDSDSDSDDNTLRRKMKYLKQKNKTLRKKGNTKEKVNLQKSNLNTISSKRRHARAVLVFTRSKEPGCTCPPPGRPDGINVLQIGKDCFNSVNDLLHFFVHILGLDHQHNMHDRDSFLQILWDKLTPELKKEMEQKLPPAASAGFAYDYQSVMHFPWLQIKDGVTSIMYPIWNDGWAMGHWQGLSSTDVQKLNLIYAKECSKRKSESL